jgi:hypothetical protein
MSLRLICVKDRLRLDCDLGERHITLRPGLRVRRCVADLERGYHAPLGKAGGGRRVRGAVPRAGSLWPVALRSCPGGHYLIVQIRPGVRFPETRLLEIITSTTTGTCSSFPTRSSAPSAASTTRASARTGGTLRGGRRPTAARLQYPPLEERRNRSGDVQAEIHPRRIGPLAALQDVAKIVARTERVAAAATRRTILTVAGLEEILARAPH